MKKIVFLLIIFIILFSNCSRKNNVTEITEENIHNIQVLNRIKYVNAPEGLRVRKLPGINADSIGILNDLAEVLVTREVEDSIIIDNIDGRWAFVETESIHGWVFDGYLSSQPPIRQGYIALIMDFFTERFLDNIMEKKNFNEIMTALKAIEENWIVTNRSFEHQFIEGIIINETVMKNEIYKFEFWDETRLMSFTVVLVEENILNLFPYKTMEEYLADDNFSFYDTYGKIFIVYKNQIIYFDHRDSDFGWIFYFNDDVLHELIFKRFIR